MESQKSLCIPLYRQGTLWGIFQLMILSDLGMENIEKLAFSTVQQFSLTVENLRLREGLRMQAIRDPLTGLYNRRYMEAALESELSRAMRKGQTVGLIMLDIDHFKQFNDRYGHDAGDVVLRQIGTFLQSKVRGEDIPCRYGGEEFLIILPEIALESAAQRAEALRAGVEEMNNELRRPFSGQLSISVGVAIYPAHGDNLHAVMLAADQALYQAKHAGRNRVVVFDNEV
jgi:diguanylate cyclase (GGDEF)-like protein